MVRSLFVVCILLFSCSKAFSTELLSSDVEIELKIEENERSSRINLLTAERVLYAANQALDAAAVIVSSVSNDRIVHAELRRLAAGIPGARAIIILSEDGTLLHDSYKYPVVPLNLSDRTYFKKALSRRGLIIGEQIVGRTSGANFIPIVKRQGAFTIVVVANPFALVDVQNECDDCWALTVLDEGNILTMFPPEAKVSGGLMQIVASSKEKRGTKIVRYHNSVVALSWRRSPKFPIASVSIKGLPDRTPVEVNIH